MSQRHISKVKVRNLRHLVALPGFCQNDELLHHIILICCSKLTEPITIIAQELIDSNVIGARALGNSEIAKEAVWKMFKNLWYITWK